MTVYVAYFIDDDCPQDCSECVGVFTSRAEARLAIKAHAERYIGSDDELEFDPGEPCAEGGEKSYIDRGDCIIADYLLSEHEIDGLEPRPVIAPSSPPLEKVEL
jgi:hypothetical protein